MDYINEGSMTHEEIVSVSLKNSGGILSRRSPRTIDSMPMDQTPSANKRSVFGIGMHAPPAATNAGLMQPVLRTHG